jgi:hypothetical protein
VRVPLSPVKHELPIVGSVLAALAVLGTWPLATRMTSALPNDLGDPLLVTFILGWDADRIAHGLAGFWDAPFFYPLRHTLAYSEHLLGVAVFTAPVQWLSGNAVLAYNVAFLGAPVLAGVGAYGLARELWARRDAAWLAGLSFAFAPNRVDQISHLQVLMSGWMPVALWALHRYFATGSRVALAGFVAAFSLQGLSNGYFLFFFAIAVVVIGGPELLALVARQFRRQGPSRRFGRTTAELALGAIVVGAIFLPVVRAYTTAQAESGFERSASEAEMFSAEPADYLRASPALVLWGPILGGFSAERSVFPGFVIMGLAAFGVAIGSSQAKTITGDLPRRQVLAYAALAGLAFWLSLGPTGALYAWLTAHLPGFSGLRVPARFNVLVALALATLGAAGAAWLCRTLEARRLATPLVVVLGLAIVVEGYGGPIHLETFRAGQRQRAALHEWLRTQPEGAMLELPIEPSGAGPSTLPYQFNTLHHGRPIVNGYSGWGSPLQEFLAHPASPVSRHEHLDAALEGLSALGVRYVLLHRSEFSRSVPGAYTDPLPLTSALDASRWVDLTRTFLPMQIWRLKPATAPPAAPVLRDDGRLEAGRDFSVRADGEEGPVAVTLAAPGDVGAITLVLPEAGSGLYPVRVRVTATESAGTSRVLFDDAVLPRVLAALVRPPRDRHITLPLPENTAVTLDIAYVSSTGGRPWEDGGLGLSARRRE